jgi:hypothetical protein
MSRRSLELPRRSHRIEAERTLSRPGRPAERALNAEATALRLVTGALFPVLGYDSVLALVFAMPGLPARPDTPVPTGPAYSRARSGEAPFSGAGADLLWRVKNGAKSVPFKTLKLLKDGSDLVLLRESNGMRSRRRKTAGRPGPAGPAGHRRLARLLHRADPHLRRAGESHAGQAAPRAQHDRRARRLRRRHRRPDPG